MKKTTNQIELTMNEYHDYELEKRMVHEAGLQRKRKPLTPVMDRIEAAGLDSTSHLLRVTMDRSNNSVLLEDELDEITLQPSLGSVEVQPVELLGLGEARMKAFGQQATQTLSWDTDLYEVVRFSETEGVLTLKKRGESE